MFYCNVSDPNISSSQDGHLSMFSKCTTHLTELYNTKLFIYSKNFLFLFQERVTYDENRDAMEAIQKLCEMHPDWLLVMYPNWTFVLVTCGKICEGSISLLGKT